MKTRFATHTFLKLGPTLLVAVVFMVSSQSPAIERDIASTSDETFEGSSNVLGFTQDYGQASSTVGAATDSAGSKEVAAPATPVAPVTAVAPAAPAQPTLQPTVQPIVHPTVTPAKPLKSTTTATTTTQNKPANGAKTVNVTTASSARIRSGPGMSFNVIGSVARDSSVQIIGKPHGNWVPVTNGKISGYIHNTLISGDALTEAYANCNCTVSTKAPAAQKAAKDILVAANEVAAPQVQAQATYASPAKQFCYANAIVAGAKKNVAGKYRNQPSSGGLCATGVRTSLVAAGVIDNNTSLGNAVDYKVRNTMTAAGFVNRIDQYPSPAAAPAGAVLVFAGPKSQQYASTGMCAGIACTRNNFHHDLGTYLGHVTIKGDDGLFYTDGRTVQPAINWPTDQSTRRLVGVYIMEKCVKCSQKIIRTCGG